MTYTKEQRAEDMEQEQIEDLGDFDFWIGENKENLIAEFIDEYNSEWVKFCKIKWSEYNEN